MKKNLLILFLAFLSFNFIACSDDDDPTPAPPPPVEPVEPIDAAYLVEGNYDVYTMWTTSLGHRDIIESSDFHVSKVGQGLIKIETEYIELDTASGKKMRIGTIVLDSIPLQIIGENNYTFETTDSLDFEYTIKKSEAIIKGSVINGVVSATITLNAKDISISLIFDGGQVANNKADIVRMSIHDEVIGGQPEIKGTTITIFVKPGTPLEKLKFAPEITLSKNAVSNPASGELIDFSKAIDNGGDFKYVNYVVLPEDKSDTKIYRVKIQIGNDFSKSSFEKWTPEGTDEDYADFKKPIANWSTSNPGVMLIMMFPGLHTGRAIVSDVAGQTGKGASIKTANTTGMVSIAPGYFPSIPKITSGSLFLGSFIVDMVNTLKSTKFGLPYFKKPTKVKGFFKYTPGAEYFICKDWKNANHIAELDPTKTDECALSAVLYEVSSFTNENNLLTGVDIFTSDKIVAIAQKFSAGQADLAEFELVLDYKKEYDSSKKYRLAVIFSSSKDGDKFSGAPESLLVVDEVEIINE